MPPDLRSVKSHFPIFSHHPDLVYLDNAATSQKPLAVIRAMNDFYERENASVHRGLYPLSQNATLQFEQVRKKVAGFLHAVNPDTIAFTKGTTESINLVARGFLKTRLNDGDNVIVSGMEHHANLIPWQQLCHERKAGLKVIPVNSKGDLEMTALGKLIDSKTKLIAVAHMSNLLGTINPVEDIIAEAHKKNVPVIIDAAQSAGHLPLDVKALEVDFLAFSAHKMFGPFGTGALYCREDRMDELFPANYGGGSIRNVTWDQTEFMPYPRGLEPGTPDVAGVIGMGKAIDFIGGWDLRACMDHTRNLAEYFRERIKSLGAVNAVGSPRQSGGIVSFEVDKIHPHDVASFLGASEIAVRAGHHCAQPLLESLGIPATVRASFAIYNTKDDVDKTIHTLVELKKFWS